MFKISNILVKISIIKNPNRFRIKILNDIDLTLWSLYYIGDSKEIFGGFYYIDESWLKFVGTFIVVIRC